MFCMNASTYFAILRGSRAVVQVTRVLVHVQRENGRAASVT